VAEYAAVACVATNPDVAVSSPSPFQDCRDVVYLSRFFDGTGNNREKDTESSSWSNVECMCDATVQDDVKSTYAIYIPGVGTRYNGKLLAGSTRPAYGSKTSSVACPAWRRSAATPGPRLSQ